MIILFLVFRNKQPNASIDIELHGSPTQLSPTQLNPNPCKRLESVPVMTLHLLVSNWYQLCHSCNYQLACVVTSADTSFLEPNLSESSQL